jgi:hypothetical protein
VYGTRRFVCDCDQSGTYDCDGHTTDCAVSDGDCDADCADRVDTGTDAFCFGIMIQGDIGGCL